MSDAVTSHYERGDLLEALRAGLAEQGLPMTREAISAADEFHIGGAAATDALLSHLGDLAGKRVLDLGSGLGGPARHMAAAGAAFRGVDLTPEFVRTARALTDELGMSVAFDLGDVIALDFDDGAFDLVTLIHVGMNIADKRALFAEAERVLAPGGAFGIYEVMRMATGDLTYPLPWSSEDATNHVAGPGAYREAAEAAGLTLIHERERGEVARAFFAERMAAMKDGPPPFGLHITMGPDAGPRTRNMTVAVNAGTLAPVEMIFRKEG